MTDCVTAKTFYEIGQTYYENTIHEITSQVFGAMDDLEKYNQTLQPSDDYITDYFTNYVKKRIHLIRKYQPSIFEIQCMDTTFNVARKTLEIVIDQGEGDEGDIVKHKSISQGGMITSLNATGQVTYSNRIVGKKGESAEDVLLHRYPPITLK